MKFIRFSGCTFLLLVFVAENLQGQNWLWGQQGQSSLISRVYYSPVATDKHGNAYVTGTFENTTVFGGITLTGGDTNAYLAKFNSAGKVVWAKQAINFNSSSSSVSESVTTDKDGNIFITGNLAGSATFGSFLLGVKYGYCAFLVKYDSNGNVIWAKQSSSISNAGTYNCSVTTDNSGDIIITGLFDTTATFDAYTLTDIHPGSPNVFVAKYDTAGNVLWAKQSGGMGLNNNYNYPFSIATDSAGNVYIASDFINSITFGTYTLHSLQYYSVYLVKYSSQGDVLWARQSINNNHNIFGSGYSLGYGYSVIADRKGNSYITGTFQDEVVFGTYMLSAPGGYSVFLIKYDSSGNVLWAQQSSPGWSGTGLAVDDSNYLYLSGQIIYYYLNSGILDFGGLKLTSSGNNTASFIIKFNEDGNPYCGSTLDNVGGNGENTGIAVDKTGNYIYMGGTFMNKPVVCGPDTLVSHGGGSNMLLARWEPCHSTEIVPPITPLPSHLQQAEPCNVFIPDAFSPGQNVNNILYVRSSCIASMEFLVFNRWGNKVFESQSVNRGWDGTNNGLPANMGTYMYCVKATLLDGTNVERKGSVTLVR